jgi:hypothetical protein
MPVSSATRLRGMARKTSCRPSKSCSRAAPKPHRPLQPARSTNWNDRPGQLLH